MPDVVGHPLGPWRASEVAGTGAETGLDSLMGQVARGDEVAFAELYDRLVPSVHHLAVLVLGPRPDAEVAVRQTFVELWTGAVDPQLCAGHGVETWALVTAHRTASSLRGRTDRGNPRVVGG